MNEQLTVRLPEELGRALRLAAARSQRKTSEVVRLALRDYLGLTSPSTARPADRVRNLVGSLESGVPDLAARHRDHLLESIRRGG
jgi:plasmid stability protein